MNCSEFDKRMKSYENNSCLIRKTPVILRIDGCHFHTFTKNFQKPFDEVMIDSMQATMKYLCQSIQGCVFGYTQSDEISLVLIDYQNKNTDAWFGYRIQKLCSVAASMAAMKFNQVFRANVKNYSEEYFQSKDYSAKKTKYIDTLHDSMREGAYFDCRAFNIPKEDVSNYIYWRQADCIRNSIQALGQNFYSHKQLMNKSCDEIIEMCANDYGVEWEKLFNFLKFGSACIYKEDGWVIDNEMPLIIQDRQYIDKRIFLIEN